MAEVRNRKPIDIGQVVSYLNHAFSSAIQKNGSSVGSKNTKGTKLYQLQVDFVYLINDIQRGPKNFLSRKISDANELIDGIK